MYCIQIIMNSCWKIVSSPTSRGLNFTFLHAFSCFQWDNSKSDQTDQLLCSLHNVSLAIQSVPSMFWVGTIFRTKHKFKKFCWSDLNSCLFTNIVSVPLRAELGSSVSTMSRLHPGQPENLGLIPDEGRVLSLPNWISVDSLASHSNGMEYL